MKRKGITINISFPILVFLSIALVAVLGFAGQQFEKNQQLREKLLVIQQDNIPELLVRAKSVLTFETLLENKEDPLWRYSYSYNKYHHPDLHTAVLGNFRVISVQKEGENMVLRVHYDIKYLDSSGKAIASGGFESDWLIERTSDTWFIAEIRGGGV
jgi:hypothetical protein